MNLETVRLIGRVLDSSWGRESSADGTYSIKYDLGHGKLTLKFTTIVQFASEDSLKPQVDAANNQAIQLVDAKVADLKNAYKASIGKSLKLEDLGGQDDLELRQPVGPRKVAYYRYNHVFDIQD